MNIVPYLAECVRKDNKGQKDFKESIIFNAPQTFGCWVSPHPKGTLKMRMNSLMIVFPQDTLMEWEEGYELAKDATLTSDEICVSTLVDPYARSSFVSCSVPSFLSFSHF